MNLLTDNTPVEIHMAGGLRVFVKREDLCCPLPGPSFSKMRGVVSHIAARPENVIGVLDTFHSKAGWAVAWACRELGKRAVDFWPVYKADGEGFSSNDVRDPPRIQQRRAKELGARMIALKAGRSAILYHQARKRLEAIHPGAYLMPNALKLPESVTENAAEARRTAEAGTTLPRKAALVLSVSSGTVAAGVLRGLREARRLDDYEVFLHMGYSRSLPAIRAYMSNQAGFALSETRVHFVDEKFGYADAAKACAPFPCNPYYDAKAWQWLLKPVQQERFCGRNILFWNIGD